MADWQLEHVPVNDFGTPLAEAMDGAHQFDWVASKMPQTDWQAKRSGDVQDAYYKKHKDASRNGHLWAPPTLKAR